MSHRIKIFDYDCFVFLRLHGLSEKLSGILPFQGIYHFIDRIVEGPFVGNISLCSSIYVHLYDYHLTYQQEVGTH